MSEWAILGCGYVGTRLARRLLAEGHSVRVFSRHPDKLAELGELGARVHGIDGSKSRQFGPALYGAKSPVVVYSIPSLGNMPAGEPVRRAAEAASGVGATRFIYLSSTAVYGPTSEGEVVDEDTALALFDPDAAPRVADEGAVEGARLSGLSTVVLRLAAVYGPGRGVRERIKAGSYKLIDEGEHMFSRVHVDDVVGIILAAAERAPNPGLYCVADDRPTTQKEYADWLVARLHAEALPKVASLAPGKPRRPVRNRAVSNQRLKRELGYVFRYPSYLEGELAVEAELGGQPIEAPAAVERPAAVETPAPVVAPAPPPVETPTSLAEAPRMNPFDGPYGSGATEYERYLRTPEVLALQKPAAERAHPDELLFQIVHQVEELWMKAMVHELGEMLVHCDADRLLEARESLERVEALGELLERQLKTLFETMLPSAYLEIRKGLGHGSGLDSPGFVRLNQIAPEVWAAFERALGRSGVDLMKLYTPPGSNAALLALAEALLDFDAAMQRFKREHLLVVRRIIGIGTASLRSGNPMELLERSAQVTYFPALWAVRDGLFTDFKNG